MNKQAWKIYYRKLRIIRRECIKANTDMMLYGTGFVRVDEEGFVNHVLPHMTMIKLDPTPQPEKPVIEKIKKPKKKKHEHVQEQKYALVPGWRRRPAGKRGQLK